MNTATDDRRVRKTKKALREGLADLMMEKDLRSITVRELVDKIDIHRATFYSHYTDIYDLYKQMEDGVVEELSAIVGDITLSDEAFYETLISYVYDNAKLCRMFLSKNGTRSFLDRISSFLSEKYIAIWTGDAPDSKVIDELRYLVGYHISGCLDIISRWAESDFALSKEIIVEMVIKVDKNFDVLLSN